METSNKQKIEFTLDDLYKTLKTHDLEILKHFNDPDLSDSDYLFYAINSDICSNALGIVINLLLKNPFSIGIDLNCRTLMEAFVILRMIAEGEITPLQAKIFRFQYALVDKGNFRKILQKNGLTTPKYLSDDAEKALGALSEHFKMPKRKILKDRYLLNDPRLYLKKKPDDDIKFSTLMDKYRQFGDETGAIYSLFSIFVHPRYDAKWEQGIKLQEKRLECIDLILDYVFRYLHESKLLLKDETITGFHQDFTDRKELEGNLCNIFCVRSFFQEIRDKTCSFPEGIDSYSVCFLSRIEDCIVDMMLSESLGYNEQVIAKFKPFIENAAVYSKINSTSDMTEFNARKNAYFYSSILQVTEQLGPLGFKEDDSLEDEIRKVFNEYYAKAYGVEFDLFLDNLKNQRLYCLSPNKAETTYSRIVKDAILETIEPEHHEYVELLYALSQDMSHASGYNFNSSPGMADVYCHMVMEAVCRYMIRYLLNVSLVFEEHKRPVDFSVMIKLFSKMVEVESGAVSRLSTELAECSAS